GLPINWGRLAGLYMPHPPMSARFEAIARIGGVAPERVKEVASLATKVPPLPGYTSPFERMAPAESGILSSHRDRIQKQLLILSRGLPVLAGISAPATMLFFELDFGTGLMLTAGWILVSMLVYYAAYELMVGLERRRVRNQLPDARGG